MASSATTTDDVAADALRMGLAAARDLLRQAVEASADAAAAAEARAVVDGLGAPEAAAVRVALPGGGAAPPGACIIYLAPCPRDHDLSAQLEPLRARLPADVWGQVLMRVSILLHAARAAYSILARRHADLLRRLAPAASPTEARVDQENTTLYLDPSWPERVGLYVADAPAGAADAADTTNIATRGRAGSPS